MTRMRHTLVAAAILQLGGVATTAAQPVTSTPPTISDPQLAPPDAAPGTVESWDAALGLIRRSPDYLTSVSAVERAVAQRRVALAAVIPSVIAQGSYVHNFNTESIPFGGAVLVEPPKTIWQISGTATWALGPRAVVIKRGEYGFMMYTQERYFILPAFPSFLPVTSCAGTATKWKNCGAVIGARWDVPTTR